MSGDYAGDVKKGSLTSGAIPQSLAARKSNWLRAFFPPPPENKIELRLFCQRGRLSKKKKKKKQQVDSLPRSIRQLEPSCLSADVPRTLGVGFALRGATMTIATRRSSIIFLTIFIQKEKHLLWKTIINKAGTEASYDWCPLLEGRKDNFWCFFIRFID